MPSVPVPVRIARLLDQPLSVDRLVTAVRSPATGGVAVFIGTVRDHDGGEPVVALEYSAHPSAQTALQTCVDRVVAAHPEVAVAVEHRTGRLEVGDVAVVVATAAAHRGPALRACAALIEDLKAEVPIWKSQQFGSGESAWVGLP